jgi:hypothetical protein
MAFSLSQFRSSINTNGIAKTNTYEVVIGIGTAGTTPGASLRNITNIDTNTVSELTLRCQSVQLPEIDLLTIPYYPKVVGGGERRVVGMNQYKVIPMEFIVDKDMRVVRFFEAWLQGIINYASAPGQNFNAINGNQLPYEMSYRDEYAVQIDINVWPTGEVGTSGTENTAAAKTYTLHRAFPVNMGNVTLSWADENKYMILPIGFTYDSISLPNMNTGNVGFTDIYDITQGPIQKK